MITQLQAEALVRKMFAAHAKTAVQPVVDEYAEIVARAICEGCAVSAVELARTEGKRVPSGPELRGEIRRLQTTPLHLRHLGTTARSEEVSKIEAFWRQEATKAIRPHCNRDDHLAGYVAAQMWDAGLPADYDAVVDELANEGRRRIWIQSAFTYLHGRGGSSKELTEARFARARKIATAGIESLEASELVS